MDSSEYLVSYGVAGYFGRFVAGLPMACRRGDPVVIRSHRGVEVGQVLCEATVGHAHLLGEGRVGELLRRVEPPDEARAAALGDETLAAYEFARRLAQELHLPFEVLDIEALWEPRSFILHYLGDRGDPRNLVSTLAKQFDAYIELHETMPAILAEEEIPVESGTCGNGSCGTCGSTGGSCGTGGCGSCGSGCGSSEETDWQSHFAELRLKMDRRFSPSS